MFQTNNPVLASSDAPGGRLFAEYWIGKPLGSVAASWMRIVSPSSAVVSEIGARLGGAGVGAMTIVALLSTTRTPSVT